MGLDMGIVRIRKPSLDDSRIYDKKELVGNYIALEQNDLNEPMYEQLTQYMQKVLVRKKEIDIPKIRNTYELSDAASYIGSGGSRGICVVDGGRILSLAADEVENKFTKESVLQQFVCCAEEVQYWRKEYDIQQWFYDNLDSDIENTGYYLLNDDVLRRFNRKYPEYNFLADASEENSALFYWEWY